MAVSPAVPRPDTLQHLKSLIGFDTVSAHANLQLIEFVADFLQSLGFGVEIQHNETGKKANLVARHGPDKLGGLMLAGHTDVVPVEGQNWSFDPFKAVERDGRVYGRGACDMKGFFAAVFGVLPSIDPTTLKRPLYLALTYDEEIGCFGAQSLAATLAQVENSPARCIVGEPTGMSIVLGHKGKLSVDCTVHGAECHSAYNNEGVNAVEIAAELITRLRAMQARILNNGPFDHRFNPPHTTIHTGLVQGGTARNIVPRDCRFELEIRNLPDQDAGEIMAELEAFAAETLVPEMQAISKDCGINLRPQSNIPGLLNNADGAFARYVLDLSGRNKPEYVSFATEAGLYQNIGTETVICGPGRIEQAHKPDEYVELSQLAQCEAFVDRVIRDSLIDR